MHRMRVKTSFSKELWDRRSQLSGSKLSWPEKDLGSQTQTNDRDLGTTKGVTPGSAYKGWGSG